MVLKQKYLVLEGLDAGISLKVNSAFMEALPYIFSHWPFEIVADADRDIFATIELKDDGRFYLTSPFIEKKDSYNDPLNVICALVAELAWQRLREDPTLLCIHGAAAEFSGRLVVFPATRKAGKSTLSVAMAAAGLRMFTDDFLPISVEDDRIIYGISSGVSPRLRRPFPNQIGEAALEFMARRPLLSNNQYTYVKPLKTESAAYGEAQPLGGFVFLERVDGAEVAISEISTADALKTLICQNFSRTGNAADILAMLEFVALNLPCYLLKYDHAEPAIDLLKAEFAAWNSPLPRFSVRPELENETPNGKALFDRYSDVETGQFEHAYCVKTVSADGQRFLTGRNGQSIHYLNEGAALIWQILNEPASLDEAVEILCAAFPEQTEAAIKKDVLRCFKDFGKNGLLRKIERAPELELPSAERLAP
ncbi:MAG: PqqD family peptide modification chaperone [Rhodobacteraceae bacterium]|nr:PqqD family peptide modification chaperone [Paracoccaceae bacterium]